MPFVGHPRLKFRAGRSHDNVALVSNSNSNRRKCLHHPRGKPVGVRDRIRTPIDDNFDPRGGNQLKFEFEFELESTTILTRRGGRDQFEFEFKIEIESTTAILELDSCYASTGLTSNCSSSSSRSRSSSSSVPSIYPFRVEFIYKYNCFSSSSSSSSSSSGAHYDYYYYYSYSFYSYYSFYSSSSCCYCYLLLRRLRCPSLGEWCCYALACGSFPPAKSCQ